MNPLKRGPSKQPSDVLLLFFGLLGVLMFGAFCLAGHLNGYW